MQNEKFEFNINFTIGLSIIYKKIEMCPEVLKYVFNKSPNDIEPLWFTLYAINKHFIHCPLLNVENQPSTF